MKTLAIDIDGTWTSDPAAFIDLVQILTLRHDWSIIIVTGSPQPPEKLARLGITDLELPIITCAPGQLKRGAAWAAGYDVTVWMDDMPGTIEPQRKLEEVNPDEL